MRTQWTVASKSKKLAVEAQDTALKVKLLMKIGQYNNVRFDIVEIASDLGPRVAVFIVKGDQYTVLYDKTRDFPSAKLMASLVLMGSP